jgi:hypothetical protein
MPGRLRAAPRAGRGRGGLSAAGSPRQRLGRRRDRKRGARQRLHAHMPQLAPLPPLQPPLYPPPGPAPKTPPYPPRPPPPMPPKTPPHTLSPFMNSSGRSCSRLSRAHGSSARIVSCGGVEGGGCGGGGGGGVRGADGVWGRGLGQGAAEAAATLAAPRGAVGQPPAGVAAAAPHRARRGHVHLVGLLVAKQQLQAAPAAAGAAAGVGGASARCCSAAARRRSSSVGVPGERAPRVRRPAARARASASLSSQRTRSGCTLSSSRARHAIPPQRGVGKEGQTEMGGGKGRVVLQKSASGRPRLRG